MLLIIRLQRFLQRPAHAALAAVAACLVLLWVLVVLGWSDGLDAAVLRAIHHLASPWLDDVMRAVSAAGDAPAMLAGAVLFAGLVARRRRTMLAAVSVLAVCGATLTTTLLKDLVGRARPELWPRMVAETNWSFPSGHATVSSALAAAVVLLLWPTRWRQLALVLAAVFVLSVGFSRLYLGVHFPTDILAGWCVGALWALTIHRLVGRAQK